MTQKSIDLPDFERNTELAKGKMVVKAAEKGNTWRTSPFDPYLYNQLLIHSIKLEQKAQGEDPKGIIDAALDIINFANMIADNARDHQKR